MLLPDKTLDRAKSDQLAYSSDSGREDWRPKRAEKRGTNRGPWREYSLWQCNWQRFQIVVDYLSVV
jgi:hypothetical protein